MARRAAPSNLARWIRVAAAGGLGVAGAVLISARVHWIEAPGGGVAGFRFGAAGRYATVATSDVPALARAASGAWRVAAAGLALLVGVALARALARRLGLRTWPLAAGLAVAAFAALDPALLAFVLARAPSGAPDYLDVGHALRGLGVLALLASACAWQPERAPRERAVPSRAWRVASLAAAGLVCALAPELRRAATSGDVALTNDEVAYRFQAALFARGAAHQPLSASHAFFGARQIWPGSAEVPRVFAKYPPGHPAVLAAGRRIGHERAFVWLGAALSPWLVAVFAGALGLSCGLLAAWLFALSPAVLAVFGTDLAWGTSLPAALAALAAGAYALARLADGRRAWPAALAAGVALGVVALARPGTAVALAAVGIVAALPAVRDARRARLVREVLAPALLGALPAVVAYLGFCRATTGDAFTSGYALYARALSPDDRWGLANLARAPANTAFNVARLSTWLLGVGAGLVPVVVGTAVAPRGARALLVGPPLALLAFHALLTFHGVPWAGPVYLLESFGALAVLAALGVGALARTSSRPLVPLALLASVAGSALVLAHQGRAAAREAADRDAPRRAALAAGVERGVLFVPIASPAAERLWALPPPVEAPPLLLARDLGAANARLLDALPADVAAFRFDAATGAVEPLAAAD